jgi:hypothetical protein
MHKIVKPGLGWVCPLLAVGLVGFAQPAFSVVEYGIAANYPQDQGIQNDGAVIFTENFEEDSLGAMLAQWEDYKYRERMALTRAVPAVSGGTRSLFMNGFADLYRRILPGYDTVYARFYAKLDTSCRNVHHWVWLGGHNPSTAWPWPRAGTKPAGDERWSTGIEPHGAMSRWDFYTYWKDMRIDRDGNYWGNTFASTLGIPVVKGEWICVEFMVQMNNPVTAYNGEQAFWLNGEKQFHIGAGFPSGNWDFWNGQERGTWYTGSGTPFEGFQWRTDPLLNINYFWLEHYVDSDTGCECWFDDVVLAKKYIGPVYTSGAISRQGRTVQGRHSWPGIVTPNPFRGSVMIEPAGQDIPEVTIHDLQGRLVYRIPERGGRMWWDGRDGQGNRMEAGSYVVRVKDREKMFTQNIILLR